jgi:hypothetical protein
VICTSHRIRSLRTGKQLNISLIYHNLNQIHVLFLDLDRRLAARVKRSVAGVVSKKTKPTLQFQAVFISRSENRMVQAFDIPWQMTTLIDVLHNHLISSLSSPLFRAGTPNVSSI